GADDPHAPGGALQTALLAKHSVTGKRSGQLGPDHLLHPEVGLGHRSVVGLAAHLERAGEHLDCDPVGPVGQLAGEAELLLEHRGTAYPGAFSRISTTLGAA